MSDVPYTAAQATTIAKVQRVDGDECAIETIFEMWPVLTRDDAVDVLNEILRKPTDDQLDAFVAEAELGNHQNERF